MTARTIAIVLAALALGGCVVTPVYDEYPRGPAYYPGYYPGYYSRPGPYYHRYRYYQGP